ncbi:MAG: hypothetical protein MUC59_16490, partial [Saprospiraceae bacterium]|nr:hypothetical protein [Saprospiraceae bacterium]
IFTQWGFVGFYGFYPMLWISHISMGDTHSSHIAPFQGYAFDIALKGRYILAMGETHRTNKGETH